MVSAVFHSPAQADQQLQPVLATAARPVAPVAAEPAAPRDRKPPFD